MCSCLPIYRTSGAQRFFIEEHAGAGIVAKVCAQVIGCPYTECRIARELTVEGIPKYCDICSCIQDGDDIRRVNPGFVAVVFGVVRSAYILVSVIESEQLEEHERMRSRNTKTRPCGCPIR